MFKQILKVASLVICVAEIGCSENVSRVSDGPFDAANCCTPNIETLTPGTPSTSYAGVTAINHTAEDTLKCGRLMRENSSTCLFGSLKPMMLTPTIYVTTGEIDFAIDQIARQTSINRNNSSLKGDIEPKTIAPTFRKSLLLGPGNWEIHYYGYSASNVPQVTLVEASQ